MLKKLRKKKTAKRILITLALVIIPAFVFWGFGSALRSRRKVNYVGKISGKQISIQDLQEAQSAVRNQMIMRFGDKFFEIQKFLNLKQQAWDRIILLREAKRRKIKATDREVIELIENLPYFAREGKFDNRIYNEALQYIFRTQPRLFEEQMRQNIILDKLYNQVTTDIKLDDEEIKEEYKKLNEELSIDYIASIPSDFTKDIDTSEEDIKEYFTENKTKFKLHPSFNIEYITLENEEKIKELAKNLQANKNFNQAARQLKLGVKETGLFTLTDPIPEIGWSAEILNIISKLSVGQHTQPILFDKKYYVLKLKEKKDAYIPKLQEIQDRVKEALLEDESKNIAKEKINECSKKLKDLYEQNPKSVNFEKMAKDCALKSGSTEAFKFGSYIEGIGGSDNFWLAAKGLKENEFSKIISAPSGFYIIRLKSRVPIDEEKFKEEKEKFAEKLLNEKKLNYFANFAQNLKSNAQLNINTNSP